jgi:hypothetical protein
MSTDEGNSIGMEEEEITKLNETLETSVKERNTSFPKLRHLNSLNVEAGRVSNITHHSSKVFLPFVFSSFFRSLISLLSHTQFIIYSVEFL